MTAILIHVVLIAIALAVAVIAYDLSIDDEQGE